MTQAEILTAHAGLLAIVRATVVAIAAVDFAALQVAAKALHDTRGQWHPSGTIEPELAAEAADAYERASEILGYVRAIAADLRHGDTIAEAAEMNASPSIPAEWAPAALALV